MEISNRAVLSFKITLSDVLHHKFLALSEIFAGHRCTTLVHLFLAELVTNSVGVGGNLNAHFNSL